MASELLIAITPIAMSEKMLAPVFARLPRLFSKLTDTVSRDSLFVVTVSVVVVATVAGF